MPIFKNVLKKRISGLWIHYYESKSCIITTSKEEERKLRASFNKILKTILKILRTI